jgi:hypothetical protein
MTTADAGNRNSPEISLRQVSLCPGSGGGLWRIRWHVENLGGQRLQLKAARFPHGQFRADEQNFGRAISLDHGECGEFEATVACDAKPGEIVENAFVIFSATWRDNPWRIFVRLRVVVNEQGEPEALTELITSQQVGFSNELRSER